MKEKIVRLAKKLDLDQIVNDNTREDDSDDFKMSSKGFVPSENKQSKALNDPKKRVPTQKQLESLKTAREKAHEVVRAKGTISRAKKEEEIRKRDELLEKAKQLKHVTVKKEDTPVPAPQVSASAEGVRASPAPQVSQPVKKSSKKKIVYVSESESSSSEEEVVVVKKTKSMLSKKRGDVSPRSPSPPPVSEKQHRINSFLSAYYGI